MRKTENDKVMSKFEKEQMEKNRLRVNEFIRNVNDINDYWCEVENHTYLEFTKLRNRNDVIPLCDREYGEVLKKSKETWLDKRKHHQCKSRRKDNKIVADTKSYIERGQKLHSDSSGNSLYDYCKFLVTSTRDKDDKATLICKRCSAEFLITPEAHIQNTSGCKVCGHEDSGVKRRTSSEDHKKEINEKFKEKYGFELNLDKCTIETSRSEIQPIDPDYGEYPKPVRVHQLKSKLNRHPDRVEKGKRPPPNKMTVEELKKKSIKQYGDCHDWEDFEIHGTRAETTFFDRVHGEYQTTPVKHLAENPVLHKDRHRKGGGGFDITRRGYLYLYTFDDKQARPWLKYGITNKSVIERVKGTLIDLEESNYTLIKKWPFEKGAGAVHIENKLKKRYQTSSYENAGSGAMKNGHTETVPIDYRDEVYKFIESLL